VEKNSSKLGDIKHRLSKNSKVQLISAVVVLFFDQLTKFSVLAWIPFGYSIEMLPILSFVFVLNDGISFSLLSGVSRLVLIPLSLVIITFVIWLAQKNSTSNASAIGYGFIIGGAIGNVFDRSLHGAVIDFILFHYSGWSFPIFNVADTGISCGVAILLIDSFFSPKMKK
tara:strand:+ start:400 stop:909 length:510 start_codon:yes stop_codon:yes gene_type:complete